ncbi:MAG: hypothetical protein F4078_04955 [Acidimicrobiia bacterium]|nr:hypothetical protein [bacterium]MXZ29917.1 hypothetical protein [Acidimicrobiia bacterium]MYB24347.1 hypothetical protein [Acidimicrobiia bacterium]MYJ13642.1 hypothetical protein [Acidimicrobiia bacterium]
MSLWVVLMVPVTVFAAVAAMAEPQRLRAEASLDEAAADLAELAAAWRYGEQTARGPLSGFPPECAVSDPSVSGRCELLAAALARDLSATGVDLGSLRGYYSDSLTTSRLTGAQALPCEIGDPAAHRSVVVDAAHVAVVADWREAGWAAAQVWSRGLRMGAEAVGRLTIPAAAESPATVPACGTRLDVSDSAGRSLRVSDPAAPSRRLRNSVPARTPFGG